MDLRDEDATDKFFALLLFFLIFKIITRLFVLHGVDCCGISDSLYILGAD